MAVTNEVKEFGGTPGAMALMIFSHVVPFYFSLSLKYASGGLYYARSFRELFVDLQETCWPTLSACSIYLGFTLIQLIFAVILPGVRVKGLPIPTENNRQYEYNCNALASWYVTLVGMFLVRRTGLFSLTTLADQFGSILCVSVLFSDILSWVLVNHANTHEHPRTPPNPKPILP